MKSSPNSDELASSAELKTPTNGKKLVQARLPFKTLSGSEPPKSIGNETISTASPADDAIIPSVENSNRKRKQHSTVFPGEGIRAPKINRVENSSDDIILITTETMESSCDLSIADEVNENQLNHSESKENVCVDNNNTSAAMNEIILLDSDVENDIEQQKESKAKLSLDFNETPTENRRSKRVQDADMIKIKLPISKKAKEAAKKAKKQKKNESNENDVKQLENASDDKMKKEKPSTSQSNTDEETGNDASSIANESLDTSMLNISLTSNASNEPSTPNSKLLTPKQTPKSQRRAESEKKLLEKQREREERERLRKLEREEKGFIYELII